MRGAVCPDLAKIRRFDKKYRFLGNLLDTLLSIWQPFAPTLAFLCYGSNCQGCTWPKNE